jgi:manganese/zinc/iron transport system substrate-binding protein
MINHLSTTMRFISRCVPRLSWSQWGTHGVLVASLCLLSCSGVAEDRFTIVATTSMIGDAVRNIVQDRARVVVLMGPGVDPHTYKATYRDVRNILDADIVFYNGLHLEGKMADMLHKLGHQKRVFSASNALLPEQQLVDPNFSIGVDPHIWFDVCLWKQVIQYISDQLQLADPQRAAYYQANTRSYLEQLDTLHHTIQQAIQSIPHAQRILITAHDAFGYFGRAYAMEVRGLQGISTVSECGLKDVTDLVRLIIQKNIKAIFLETSVPEKPLQAVVEGCNRQGFAVKIGGHLYSDALGQVGTPEGTYCGMMQANVNTIVSALTS